MCLYLSLLKVPSHWWWYKRKIFWYKICLYKCTQIVNVIIFISIKVMRTAVCDLFCVNTLPATRWKTWSLVPIKGSSQHQLNAKILNSWFRASQFNVNKNPARCNSMQIFIHCKVTLHVSGVTAPVIRSTKNCNRNLRYRS